MLPLPALEAPLATVEGRTLEMLLDRWCTVCRIPSRADDAPHREGSMLRKEDDDPIARS